LLLAKIQTNSKVVLLETQRLAAEFCAIKYFETNINIESHNLKSSPNIFVEKIKVDEKGGACNTYEGGE
jgi:hypothetical protein